jgi:hypothetical protein
MDKQKQANNHMHTQVFRTQTYQEVPDETLNKKERKH